MIADNSSINNIKPLGFIGTFLGTCSGTTVFTALCRHSVLRMLWHLFLLSVLLSFAVTLIGKKNSSAVIAASREIFISSFGEDITVYPSGKITPEKSPDSARTLFFPTVMVLLLKSISSQQSESASPIRNPVLRISK